MPIRIISLDRCTWSYQLIETMLEEERQDITISAKFAFMVARRGNIYGTYSTATEAVEKAYEMWMRGLNSFCGEYACGYLQVWIRKDLEEELRRRGIVPHPLLMVGFESETTFRKVRMKKRREDEAT